MPASIDLSGQRKRRRRSRIGASAHTTLMFLDCQGSSGSSVFRKEAGEAVEAVIDDAPPAAKRRIADAPVLRRNLQLQHRYAALPAQQRRTHVAALPAPTTKVNFGDVHRACLRRLPSPIPTPPVIPAKAGTRASTTRVGGPVDPGVRRDDVRRVGRAERSPPSPARRISGRLRFANPPCAQRPCLPTAHLTPYQTDLSPKNYGDARMPIGPTLILDKSALQSLQAQEARWLGHHFRLNLIEPLYIEIAGASTASDRKNPIGDLASLATKLLEMVPTIAPNMRHNQLKLGNLLGLEFELDGRIIPDDIQTILLPDGRVVQFQDEPPHFEALRRWARGELNDREKKGATSLRNFIASVDLNRIKEVMQSVPTFNIKTPQEALELVDWILGKMRRFQGFKQMMADLHVPMEHYGTIIKRWKAMGGPLVSDFSPYPYFLWRVDRFLDIGIRSGLISTKESKTYIDTIYLYYLPFCEVFVSGDKFHRETIPLFLKPYQRFCWGPDIKADATKLRAYYEALPADIRRTGSMSYARLPPKEGDFLVSRIFDELRPGWRDW